MRIAVVYESMFGSTRLIAQEIAEGLGGAPDVKAIGVAEADDVVMDGLDLIVVGGPTHAWGMSRPSTRRGAPLHVNRPRSGLVLEPGADSGPGVREWISSLDRVHTQAAAFDTRVSSAPLFTGRASKGIARELTRHGLTVIGAPESFLVDKGSHLLAGELERARAWGARLGTVITPKLTERS